MGLLAVAVVCVITLISGISQSATVSIYQSNHDLSIFGSARFTFMTAQVCVFCHTPHGNPQNISIVPRSSTIINSSTGTYSYGSGAPMLLWNRALSNAGDSGGGGYSTYTSATMTADNGTVRGYSLLCLSCHDGIGALNVMFNPPYDPNPAYNDTSPADGYPDPVAGGEDQIGDRTTAGKPIGANIGGRLTDGSDDWTVHLEDDHPISFDYDSDLVTQDGGDGLEIPDNINGEVGNTVKLRLFPSISGGDKSSLECSTCHDVHDQGTQADGDYPFLAMSNEGSAMCLNCHKK